MWENDIIDCIKILIKSIISQIKSTISYQLPKVF